MKLLLKLSVVPIFCFPLIAGWAGTQEEAKVVEQPPAKTIEPWQITVEGPGWLAGVSGHTGFHGVNPYVNVGVGQILKHLNAISTFAAEVRRDRFGVQGGLLYLNAQAGTDTSGLGVKGRSELATIHRPILWFLPSHRRTQGLARSAGGL